MNSWRGKEKEWREMEVNGTRRYGRQQKWEEDRSIVERIKEELSRKELTAWGK